MIIPFARVSWEHGLWGLATVNIKFQFGTAATGKRLTIATPWAGMINPLRGFLRSRRRDSGIGEIPRLKDSLGGCK